MLFDDPAKRYPHLVQALNTLGRRRFDARRFRGRWKIFVVVAAFLTFFLLKDLGETRLVVPAWAPTALLSVCGLLLVLRPKGSRGLEAQPNDRARAATEVARQMGLMLAKRRLHRDLDPGSLSLLDECAQQWMRATASLEDPYWSSAAAAHRQVRNQARRALDDAMDDVLLHYRAFVPSDVPNRHAMDFVDEALDHIVRGGTKATSFPPAAFGPVREIADKLRSLADESERLCREARTGQGLPEFDEPGRPLDQTLRDLRDLRSAEQELRQNLGG